MTAKYPDISVILSSCGPAQRLRETVASVLAQSFSDFELIVIDDGTPEPIRARDCQDARVVLVRNEQNIGLTRSLNKGLGLARGRYIARIDAGDVCLPDRLQKQLEFLEGEPDVSLVGTGAELVSPQGVTTQACRPFTDERRLRRALPKRNGIFHSSIMFRNEPGMRYREKFYYAQDYDLYLGLLASGRRMVNLPDLLIRYLVDPDALSYRWRVFQALFADKAREFYRQRMTLGQDHYEDFDPATILSIDIDRSKDPRVLTQEMKAAFEIGDMARVRRLYKRYARARRIPDRRLLYLLASFFPAALRGPLSRLCLLTGMTLTGEG